MDRALAVIDNARDESRGSGGRISYDRALARQIADIIEKLDDASLCYSRVIERLSGLRRSIVLSAQAHELATAELREVRDFKEWIAGV